MAGRLLFPVWEFVLWESKNRYSRIRELKNC